MPTHHPKESTKQESRTPRQGKRNADAVKSTQTAPQQLQMAMAEPGLASPQAILGLQRLVGNRAVSQLLQAKALDEPARGRHGPEAAPRRGAPMPPRQQAAFWERQETSEHDRSHHAPLGQREATASTIQRAIGRYHAQQVLEDNWVFFVRNPHITLSSSIDFRASDLPLVIFGSIEEVKKNFDAIAKRKMFVDFAHEESGQGQDFFYEMNSGNPTFSINITYQEVTPAIHQLQEIMDARGMAVKQLVDGMVNVLGGLTALIPTSELYELFAGGRDVFTGLLDVPGKVSGPSEEIRNIGKPKSRPEPKTPLPSFHMVTITPAWAPGNSTYTFDTTAPNVEEVDGGVWLPVENLRDAFNNALAGTGGVTEQTNQSKGTQPKKPQESGSTGIKGAGVPIVTINKTLYLHKNNKNGEPDLSDHSTTIAGRTKLFWKTPKQKEVKKFFGGTDTYIYVTTVNAVEGWVNKRKVRRPSSK